MIKRDIARTFPDHSFFKDKDGIGQGTLFNVIKVSQCLITRLLCQNDFIKLCVSVSHIIYLLHVSGVSKEELSVTTYILYKCIIQSRVRFIY